MSIKYSTFRKIKETFTGYGDQVGSAFILMSLNLCSQQFN
jgi:hypothetical protein